MSNGAHSFREWITWNNCRVQTLFTRAWQHTRKVLSREDQLCWYTVPTSQIGRTIENSDDCDGVHPCSCDSLLLADGTCGSENHGRSCCGEWETNIHFIRCCDSLYCSKGAISLPFHFSKHNFLRCIDHLHMEQKIPSGQTACKLVTYRQIL